ncbi:TPA: hypothetical protein ACJIO6_004873, partial [Escherichia coli]
CSITKIYSIKHITPYSKNTQASRTLYQPHLDCFPFSDTAARGVIKVRNFQQYGVLLFTTVMHQPVLAIVVITV